VCTGPGALRGRWKSCREFSCEFCMLLAGGIGWESGPRPVRTAVPLVAVPPNPVPLPAFWPDAVPPCP
jgi:hypothetical protein